MKTKLLILSVLILIVACSNEEEEQNRDVLLNALPVKQG